MMRFDLHRCGLISVKLLLVSFCWICVAQPASATDYFLTIGGGYEPSGNQASLEANVVFFQQVLTEKHPAPFRHDIYFADGHGATADLQVLVEKPAKSTSPATDLLAALHRRGDQVDVAYRNHRVPQIVGALEPTLIRTRLEQLARTARDGDRLIIYVTAHGSEGPEGDEFNTTIDCWNEKKITAREFAGWLNKVPPKVPVVMVMAQCYCGGFGHTIFQGLDETKGLAPQIRVGFFAQQYNLPAAGCRPDIEHDEEFSSYFWGALAGRSRNGVPIKDCDVDRNGVISFAEAYAYAVIAGETIDIPFTASEALLRTYSRLKAAESKDAGREANPKAINSEPQGKDDPASATNATQTPITPPSERPALRTFTGSLQSFVDRSRPVSGHIVTQLSKSLGFSLEDDVSAVKMAYDAHRREGRGQGRGRGRRGGGSGRRDLLAEVAEKWKDLADEQRWEKSDLLKPENQEKLFKELKELPSWKTYEERVKQRAVASKDAEKHELRAVKFRRLINALEIVVLEKNLPLVATSEVVTRYQQIMTLEGSTLNSAERPQKKLPH